MKYLNVWFIRWSKNESEPEGRWATSDSTTKRSFFVYCNVMAHIHIRIYFEQWIEYIRPSHCVSMPHFGTMSVYYSCIRTIFYRSAIANRWNGKLHTIFSHNGVGTSELLAHWPIQFTSIDGKYKVEITNQRNLKWINRFGLIGSPQMNSIWIVNFLWISSGYS